MFGNTFFEIAAILGLAALLGILGQKLRQPLLIMFLLAGVLAGPSFLGVIHSYEEIELLAHMGIALLLFIVGLKLDLNLIRTTGPVAFATGLGQIVFTSAIGFIIALAMGMSVISAAYVAVALTFSSTIIIVKLLSDKKEIDSLHGQIAVGFLIVQDIAAILALITLTAFGSPLSGEQTMLSVSLILAAKGLGLLCVVGLLMLYVLPGLTRRCAHSQEMLVLFAIAWAVLLGAGSEWLGFSKEVGAFVAGISLASTGYRDAISARLTTLRDFLLLFFFIDLGARLDWSTVGAQLGASVVFSLFVLIGNPIIVLIIMGVMGYRRRTSFLAGLTVAQISEFSLIVAALGLSLGHIAQETMGLITLVGVVTIFCSTYMIVYSDRIYRYLSEFLRIFERRYPFREAAIDSPREAPAVDVVMVGMGNYGSGIAEYLLRRNKVVAMVDFDPIVLQKWRSRGITVLYGDMADPEIHEHLPLDRTHWVASTVRSRELSLALARLLKSRNYRGKLALTAANEEEVEEFRREGAHLVFRPFADAAEQAADALTGAVDSLPEEVAWPVGLREVRVLSDSRFVGRKLRDIPLRQAIGVSLLAVSRAGKVYYDLGPEFRVFPGDRLVAIGPPEQLKAAEALLNEAQGNGAVEDESRFEMAEVSIGEDSELAGMTLADAQLRQKHGVNVVGIRRGKEQIVMPGPAEKMLEGDSLIVIGTSKAVEAVRELELL